MKMQLLCICLLLATGVYGAVHLRFAHYYRSHMVLQMAPAKAQIWGYAATVGDIVSVRLNGTRVANATVTRRHDGQTGGTWSALLPAQHAGGPYNVDIRSKDGHVILTDVLFGDVWVCSGQSNMAFKMSGVFNHSYELQQASSFDKIRITKINLLASNVTVDDPRVQLTWRKPETDRYTDTFSAVCLMFAEELAPHINRPIGLVQTAWGGTPIEAWSSPDALTKCSHRMKRGPSDKSTLWNSMVYPLRKMAIYGAIWYQGENNTPHPGAYACQFPAMIDDWRAKFNAGSHHQTDKLFPFGFVQLAANANKTLHFGFPDLRWSQTANYGYVPNPRMQNVFMAVAMDLPDFSSPQGTIHPRDKQDVAERLALAGRAVAYKDSNLDYQGPIPDDFTISGHTLIIEFDHGNSAVEVRKTDGFEICCGHTSNHTCHYNHWKPAPIIGHDQSTVTIDISACKGFENVVSAVRYAWEMSPCKFKMCTLYDSNNDLPAATFVKYGPFKAQST